MLCICIHISNNAEMKRWYNESMQNKQTVQEAIRDFNLFKSEDNRKKRYMRPKGITNIIVENANKISTVKDVIR